MDLSSPILVDSAAPASEPVTDVRPTLPAEPAPVSGADRLTVVDTLRGMAVLGILLMNILPFGQPMAADSNPNLGPGGAEAGNLAFWLVSHILFEGKMRATFSMLFGAGVILLTSRAEQRSAVGVADVYYRRQLWLIAFGILHAYLLWFGDILYAYGLLGLMLFPLRKLPAWGLLVGGVLLLAVISFKGVYFVSSLKEMQARAEKAEAAQLAGKRLDAEQISTIAAWNGMRRMFAPSAEQLQKEIDDHRGGYLRAFLPRAGMVVQMQSTFFYQFGVFDVGGMMLIGMALMKLGVFSGERSNRFYLLMVLLGYGIGVTVNTLSGLGILQANFHPQSVPAWPQATYGLGRLTVALGHIGVLVLLCKNARMTWMTTALAAVGQMALTNYLMETVLCCLVFEGYGLGLFGSLKRYQLLFVVAGVWTILVVFSLLWLRWFRFGPAEWLWRALAYWKWPGLRREPSAPVAVAPASA